MAKLIELTGSPGVGKTTFYKALVSKWRKNYDWIPAEALYPGAKPRYQNVKTLIQAALQKLTRKPGHNKIFQEAGNRFVAKYPQYINAVWEDINLNKQWFHGKDLRFQDAAFMLKSFQKIQILSEAETNKYVLKDEGVVHRIPHNVYSDNIVEERKRIASLIPSLPLPAAIIYLTCDPEENAKRLANRKYVWEGHRSLNINQLKDYSLRSQKKRNTIMEMIRQCGVPVLSIDSTSNKEENIGTILQYIANLDHSTQLSKQSMRSSERIDAAVSDSGV